MYFDYNNKRLLRCFVIVVIVVAFVVFASSAEMHWMHEVCPLTGSRIR